MPTISLNVSAVSLQQTKIHQVYGMPSVLPVHREAGLALLRAPTARIPEGAIITSARLSLWQYGVTTAERSFDVRETTEAWSTKTTFAGRPATGAVVDTVTMNGAENKRWDFDVTTAIQARVDGDLTPYGWQLAAGPGETDRFRFYGTTAARRQPVLVVEYVVLPEAPSNLSPAGPVSSPLPWLTWDADDAITRAQVIIYDSTDTVVFYTGEIPVAGGVLQLDETTYEGLEVGEEYTWQVVQGTSAGWSPASDKVPVSYVPQDVLAITQPPGDTFGDWTPPITWTYSGTQVAWRAWFESEDGTLFDDSGYTPGDATDWHPRRGPRREGEECRIVVQVWDDTDRVAAPGAPDYVQVAKEVVFYEDTSIAPVESLTVTQDGYSPMITITGERATIPDGLDVWRDDGDGFWRVASYEGNAVDLFDGTTFTIEDWSAPMRGEIVYKVTPRVNGGTIKTGPTASIRPRVRGIWVVDAGGEGRAAVIRVEGVTEPELSEPEQAIVHEPIGPVADGLGQVVRRRLTRYRPQGRVEGVLWEHPYPRQIPTVPDSEAWLREVREFDAGQQVRLIYSGLNERVVVAGMTFGERHENQPDRRVVSVRFDWYGQAPAQLGEV